MTPEELYRMFEQKFDKLFDEVKAVGDRLTRLEAQVQSSCDAVRQLSDGHAGSLLRIGVLEAQVQVYQERLANQGTEISRLQSEIKRLAEFRWYALGLAAGVAGAVSVLVWVLEKVG